MRKFLLFVATHVICINVFSQSKFFPPKTAMIPVTDTLHGVLLTDFYRWLENKEDPKVIDWTKAQHDYGVAFLKATQKIYPGVRNEIAAYIDIDYEGPLDKHAKRVFQTVKRKGDKQSRIYTLLDGKKILIWDPVSLDTTGNTS